MGSTPRPNHHRRRVGDHQAQPLRLAGTTPAAKYADVSTKTLRRWIAQGLLTGYRVGPRLIKVDLNELDAMLRPMRTAG